MTEWLDNAEVLVLQLDGAVLAAHITEAGHRLL
jgi:hypothetical protein